MFLAAAVAGATSQDIENGTEAVNNAAELINEYGPTVAILAVFLVIFIAMIALILRKKELHSIILSFIKGGKLRKEFFYKAPTMLFINDLIVRII